MSASSPSKGTTRSVATSASSSSAAACAACKYQRRRCAPDCPLAPYFPPEKQRQFLNAHRLFGVSNILKVLRALPDPSDRRLRDDAMASIVFESNARAADPVGGCYRIVLDLTRQIELCSAELAFVLRQLAAYKAQFESSTINNNNDDDNNNNTDINQHQQQCLDYFNGSEEIEMLGFNGSREGEEVDVKPLADVIVAVADMDYFTCRFGF